MKLKIVSYNIHKGFHFSNARFVLDEIRKQLRVINADIIFLQEVIGEHHRHRHKIKNWPEVPQFEYLAHELWGHTVYGKNAIYEHGHHGNAILSKLPFETWDNINISTNRFEQRGLMHGVILLPHEVRLHLFCVHLNLTARGRRSQMEKILEFIRKKVPANEPIIFAGDFNDWGEEISHLLSDHLGVQEAFAHNGGHAKTFPSFFPLLKLDRIYSRGLEIACTRCLTGKPWNQLSDHTPLYTEFQFIRPPKD